MRSAEDAYLHRLIIIEVTSEDVQVLSIMEFFFNFLPCSLLVPNETNDNIIRVKGQLVDEAKLSRASASDATGKPQHLRPVL